MQVIDIPSSPESSSSPTIRPIHSASHEPCPPKKRRRLGRDPSIVEFIELTDSDNDNDPSLSPFPKNISLHPGPSQQTPAKASDAMLSFGKPNSNILADGPTSVSGPSQHMQDRERQDDYVPLFLASGDDDEERVFRAQLVPATQGGPTAAPANPPPPPPNPVVYHAPTRGDPLDSYIVRVLEIVPDVQPTHVLAFIKQYMQSRPGDVVELVLHALFEDPSYPKVDRKGKHKRSESDNNSNVRGTPKSKLDYTSKDRAYNCGPDYFECSLEQLMMDFPRIPKPHIRARLLENRFYAPTYLLLAEELKRDPLPFKLKMSNSAVGKGKARQDIGFDKEREWVLLKVVELAAERDAALAASVNEQQYEENGESIECGCCFSGYPFDQMIQCPEAHLFCKSCMTSYASNLLGEHNPNIVCMDQSGCKLPFPESELGRFLSSKLLELYYRVKQRKEIEAAGLDNLEECPFCEYKCVIENEMEKLFRCENASCNAITCRTCKKPDHLPKTCKEVEEDKRLDAQHVIEEAMTQALMRNCPKCQKSFIKEMGCNKMTCPNCHTVSCYICRSVIRGYDHFANPHQSNRVNKSKCNLWDPVEQRQAEEVSEAAKRALAELRKSRPDVDETHLKVDIPVVPPPHQRPGPQLALNGGPPLPVPMMGGIRMVAPGGAGGLRPYTMGFMPAAGLGMGMGAGVGARDPFMFGAGQAHQFLPPAVLGLGAPARLEFGLHPPPAQGAAMMMPAPAEAAIPPLAQPRGRRRPVPRAAPVPELAPAPAPAPMWVHPAMAAGGRRRRGR